MKIYVARHGQDEDNKNGILNGHRDLPLTMLGRKQAKETGVKIQNLSLTFDSVLSSPLQRAHETANIISQMAKAPMPEKHLALIERDFGVMTGKPIASIEEQCTPDIIKTDTITYFLSPAGSETFPQVLKRARDFLQELSRVYAKDSTLLLVSHGDIGKMIYAAYYQVDWKQVLTQFHFGNADLLLLSPHTPPAEAHVHTTSQVNL